MGIELFLRDRLFFIAGEVVIGVEPSVNLCLLPTHPCLVIVLEYLELSTFLLPLILI